MFTDILAFDSATSAGGVLNPANRDAKSIAMRGLLETVESDERFVTALTPTGTGLLVAVKRYIMPFPTAYWLPYFFAKADAHHVMGVGFCYVLAYAQDRSMSEHRYLVFGRALIIWLTTTVPSSNTDSTSPAASSSAV